MVSPFLPKGNAAAYLSANPDASTLGLLVGAAYGLEYLHTRQPPITHGDLRGVCAFISRCYLLLIDDRLISWYLLRVKPAWRTLAFLKSWR